MNPNCILFSQRERESPKSSHEGCGRVVRWCWIIVRKGPNALAVGAGEGCLDIFSLVYIFSFLSPSLEEGPIQTEILSQRNK